VGRVVVFVLVLIIWLILTWTLNYQDLLVGIGVSFLLTIFMGDFLSKSSKKKILQPKRYLWFLLYIPVFLYFCIRANFDMAYRVIHPRLPIKPGIVKVRTTLKSQAARMVLANSITLTPGTLSIDMKGEYLYIHWIYVVSKDVEKATQIIVKKFESILKEVFE